MGVFDGVFGKKSVAKPAEVPPKKETPRVPATRPAAPAARPAVAKPGTRPPGAPQGGPAPASGPRPAVRPPQGPPVVRQQSRPGAPQPPVRNLRVFGEEADDATVQRILNFDGAILTANGGLIQTNSKQREVVAALDNGLLIIAKSALGSIEVAEVRDLLGRNKISITQSWLVDLEVVRNIYEKFNERAGAMVGRTENSAARQREFVEMVRAAASNNASDIHIKVGRHEAQVFVRINGVMVKLRDMNAQVAQEMLQAAFAMADQSDATYRPYDYQGARISEKSAAVALPAGVQAIRLQYNPLGIGGRYLIARLLYSQMKRGQDEDVDNLGYSKRQMQEIKLLRRKPTGINIISGPTGSGKSTTLQRSLSALMREKRYEVNVITIEDPPEYVIAGAAQLPVNNAKTDEERSEAFRGAITAALRSDPDIIMIGEIRDRASASLAFQAAMTGHQVWCSLHANDAASCLDRLRDMEVEPYKLTDPTLITGLIGQRLVRKLNPSCRIPLDEARHRGLIEGTALQEAIRIKRLTGTEIWIGDIENQTTENPAYVGRSVVAEVMRPDIEFMKLFRNEDKSAAIRHWASKQEGITMIEHGIIKILRGEAEVREIEDKVGVLSEVSDERIAELVEKYLNEDDVI